MVQCLADHSCNAISVAVHAALGWALLLVIGGGPKRHVRGQSHSGSFHPLSPLLGSILIGVDGIGPPELGVGDEEVAELLGKPGHQLLLGYILDLLPLPIHSDLHDM